MCFGGLLVHDPKMLADIIAAIDACFTQKRNKNAKNPEHHDTHRAHHDTCFLSEEEVAEMEQYVNNLRDKCNFSNTPSTDAEDAVEPGMHVPTSVLNDCESSFKAADEKREKASTQFFADTGLMSIICCYDELLYSVTMTHSGECQHYALALIKKLFDNLPDDMTVGLLYDIGCQLKRSMIKYEYLSNLFPRITFGVSVFHAFGHQWPCQIVYHPRKCNGFGLSDGEGCERFWSSIWKLIPILRVSGVCLLFSLSLQETY